MRRENRPLSHLRRSAGLVSAGCPSHFFVPTYAPSLPPVGCKSARRKRGPKRPAPTGAANPLQEKGQHHGREEHRSRGSRRQGRSQGHHRAVNRGWNVTAFGRKDANAGDAQTCISPPATSRPTRRKTGGGRPVLQSLERLQHYLLSSQLVPESAALAPTSAALRPPRGNSRGAGDAKGPPREPRRRAYLPGRSSRISMRWPSGSAMK